MRLFKRWLTPVLLLLAAVSSAGVAAKLSAPEERAANGRAHPITPVLSARRAPTFVAAPIGYRRLQADLDTWMRRSPVDACLSVDEAGATLYAHNPSLPLQPASAQKLLTATGALVALGADTTLPTVVVAVAPPAGDIIAGDLWLVGGGDPILATTDYVARYENQPQTFDNIAALADAIVAAGVKRVSGAVVGDESRYDRARSVDLWPPRYVIQNQVGPLSALFVNDGFRAYPPVGDDTTALVAAPDPAQYAADVLTRLLRERGVGIAGGARSGVAPPAAVTIATEPSASVGQIVGEMLLESDNGTAELLLKELGRAGRGQGSTAAGGDVLTRILREAAQPLHGAAVLDGSGLAPQNRVTCSLLVSLLDRPGTGSQLIERLPVAGRTGTLRKRFVDTLIAGRLRAKTGTLNQVTSLAGEVRPLQGGALTFAYVANVAEPARITAETLALQDQLAAILVGFPRTPNLTLLGPKPLPDG
jgi:D-alanyl-D-alanine carboxypeptidase/D-alanyl-D-alanine-endopeptidase (penicillin-binding protein 4)